MYVSNNPLKYVDPSGHDREWGYNSSYYSQYLNELGAVPPEVLIIHNQKEKSEKEAGKALIWNGALNTVKGAMQTLAGTTVAAAGVAVIPVQPVIGVAGGAVGLGYANIGLSNVFEGAQDIYNGITGNVDVQAFNPTRDTFFGGNQTAYNQAEAIFGGANLIFGIGLSYLPTSVPSGGSITEYANAGSQMSDFVDMVESSESASSSASDIIDIMKSGNMTSDGKNIIAQLEENTKVIFRMDVGENAHSMEGYGYSNPVNHINIEIQAKASSGKYKPKWNFHMILDELGEVVENFITGIWNKE